MADVLMPRLSDTMEEGVLSQWVKHEGDQVRKGDVLAVIETDKAAMEMEAYDEGVLARILVEEGASVPIGAPIAVIENAGTAPSEPAAQSPVPAPDHPERTVVPLPAPAPPSGAPPAIRVRTSPLARKLARERGIDLNTISGSGPGGRIVRADIEEAARERGGAPPAAAPAGPPGPATGSPAAAPLAAAAPAPAPAHAAPAHAAPRPAAVLAPEADAEEIPLTTVRRLTAQRLAASAREAPHFYLTVVADAGKLLAFRAQCNERRGTEVKVTVTDLLIRACATALAACPELNVSWDETRILRHRHVNIGVAVAIDDGLIVPVIRDADRKTLTETAREGRDLTARARARKLTPDELSGGTFTISNLGMYGIRQFTAVINPPQAAILAVGEAVRQPVVRDDQVTIGTSMALTLSIDHRAVDGATAARFLTLLRELIEEPLDIVL
jgi:pyruvate dehydrogenase E2 component (dihydrolipoamide acetyltransferase)